MSTLLQENEYTVVCDVVCELIWNSFYFKTLIIRSWKTVIWNGEFHNTCSKYKWTVDVKYRILYYILGVMVPVVEEFIFRGFIGYRLERYVEGIYYSIHLALFSLFPCNITQGAAYGRDSIFAYGLFEYGQCSSMPIWWTTSYLQLCFIFIL